MVVVVMNMQNEHHEFYEKAKDKYKFPHPKSRYVIFSNEFEHTIPDPMIGATDEGGANKPGYKVRKQTRNIVSLMRESQGKSDFYFFTEDDMELCPHSLFAIQYMLNKAEQYYPNFMMIRASYGMNGIIIRDEDVGSFGDYLVEHQARRPPDHLVVEWFAGENPQSAKLKNGRAHLSFRYNILHHLGKISTLRQAASKAFPICYEDLGEPILFEVEAFNFLKCGNDDISPCDVGEEVKSVPMGWKAMCDNTNDLCDKGEKRARGAL